MTIMSKIAELADRIDFSITGKDAIIVVAKQNMRRITELLELVEYDIARVGNHYYIHVPVQALEDAA